MRHFRLPVLAQPLAVRLLSGRMVTASEITFLVLAPGAKLRPAPCFGRALERAVPVPPVAAAAEKKPLTTQRAASQNKLVHSPAGAGEVDTGERT